VTKVMHPGRRPR